ncbi:tyrosine-type recombinase/integrase [Phytohabitans kaempferiae]|uniref:Tyrosine-type recombinase/integrase n=1 Tax=Phytohabitans kaempferiae TaxID=1620943 RepID=A0ABV6LXT1_9ACTN
MPDRYRALVALAGGTGLRWGECVGLQANAVNWGGWDGACKEHKATHCLACFDTYEVTVSVVRTAVEVAGTVSMKPFPKSRAGRRVVPVPRFAAELLAAHREAFPGGPAGAIFANQSGGPMRRTLFRSRVWRPALVRAGLLGRVTEPRPFKFRATWADADGVEWSAEFATEREAVAHVVKMHAGGLRFHDLRHSYATWLADAGVPVNNLAKIMGHEKPSTTLNLYADHAREAQKRVRRAFADDLLILISNDGQGNEKRPSNEGRYLGT